MVCSGLLTLVRLFFPSALPPSPVSTFLDFASSRDRSRSFDPSVLVATVFVHSSIFGFLPVLILPFLSCTALRSFADRLLLFGRRERTGKYSTVVVRFC